jgi:peroxiredoxin
MANNLTGDYDAVIEIRVQQINGLLGTLHQRRIVPGDSPSFPHSQSVRFGDIPGILQAGKVRLAEWLTTLAATRIGSAAPKTFTFPLKPAPGLVPLVEKAARELSAVQVEVVHGDRPRGRADVQISAPTISFADGATAEVTVAVEIRAHCVADVGAGNLPGPIHGDVRATYGARAKTVNGHAVLHVDVPTDDSKITFVPKPGTGLSAGAVADIATRVRQALRGDFKPLEVDLPQGFPFVDFKALGSGVGQAVALPLPVPNGRFPAGAINSLGNNFLGGSEFALAVSREYVQSFLDKITDKLKAAAAGLGTKSFWGDYTVSVSTITTTWKAGAIDVSGTIYLKTDGWFAPNGWISFTQTLTLALDVPSQLVTIKAVGDPDVDESDWISHSRALNNVRQVRDNALVSGGGTLSPTFTDARTRLSNGLQTFDSYAAATYTAVEVTPDGIIVRGAIRTSSRLDPVIHFENTNGGAALTAFQSWIPGGGIDEFTWSWIEMKNPIPWANTPEHAYQKHDFVFPKPASMLTANKVCLQIDGWRTTPDGFREDVSVANDSCTPHSHEPVLVFPPWLISVMMPIWKPRPPENGALEQAIAGHVNVAGLSRGPETLRANVLVHFAGARWEQPLTALAQAFRQARRQELPVIVVLVLPVGAFALRAGEVEARLGELGREFAGRLLITEDYLGGWSQAFAARETPGSYLLNARGEFVWSQQGAVEVAGMAAGLRQNLMPAPAPRLSPLRLNVAPGDLAPDALFAGDGDYRTALRRLRGREVLLTFWQSWSAPCLEELRRLEELQRGENAPVVLAVNGGEDARVLAEVRAQHGLTFPLVADPDQEIATRYGVQCWPTTVSINREGIVSRIQIGTAREHRPPRNRTEAAAS